eukprot:COSAG02_NODE_1691_length_11296_cov_7.891757_12_plen_49_part_00
MEVVGVVAEVKTVGQGFVQMQRAETRAHHLRLEQSALPSSMASRLEMV